jgi:hypothetical protein
MPGPSCAFSIEAAVPSVCTYASVQPDQHSCFALAIALALGRAAAKLHATAAHTSSLHIMTKSMAEVPHATRDRPGSGFMCRGLRMDRLLAETRNRTHTSQSFGYDKLLLAGTLGSSFQGSGNIYSRNGRHTHSLDEQSNK